MDKTFKIVLMVCAIVLVLAVSGSMIYYYVFFRPEIEKAEIKLQEQRSIDLEKCLKGAQKKYLEMILAITKTQSMERYKIEAEIIKNIYQADIDACNMKYGK